eukprot:650756-Prorocentrum_minimum.AAC.2
MGIPGRVSQSPARACPFRRYSRCGGWAHGYAAPRTDVRRKRGGRIEFFSGKTAYEGLNGLVKRLIEGLTSPPFAYLEEEQDVALVDGGQLAGHVVGPVVLLEVELEVHRRVLHVVRGALLHLSHDANAHASATVPLPSSRAAGCPRRAPARPRRRRLDSSSPNDGLVLKPSTTFSTTSESFF